MQAAVCTFTSNNESTQYDFRINAARPAKRWRGWRLGDDIGNCGSIADAGEFSGLTGLACEARRSLEFEAFLKSPERWHFDEDWN